MPELTISPAPTPSPNGMGNANTLSQSAPTSRPDETAMPGTERGTASPFAAVLKFRMDRKAAGADMGVSAIAPAAVAATDAGNATPVVDLAGLLPMLGADPGGMTSVAAAPFAASELVAENPDEALLPSFQAAAAQAPTEILTALPSAPTAALATNLGRQSSAAKEETVTSAGSAKPEPTSLASGKIALGAAITADPRPMTAEGNAGELPANDFHALLERAATMTPAVANPANGSSSSASLRIDTPLGQAGWQDEMGQKLTWMVGNNRQQADLVLTPPHLGRVEVSLTMNGDQATAIFTSSNPAVREALESSLHRLREVLADAGVSLGQTQVGSESPNQSSRRNEADWGLNEGVRYAAALPLPGAAVGARANTAHGMVDIFA